MNNRSTNNDENNICNIRQYLPALMFMQTVTVDMLCCGSQ